MVEGVEGVEKLRRLKRLKEVIAPFRGLGAEQG